jgi:hypothetical protein
LIIFCGNVAPASHLWGARWPIIFSVENDQCTLHDRHDRRRSVMCTEEAYRLAYLASRGLVSDLSGRYMHEIVHGHAHVQTNHVNFCACTCAHMHKTDLPIDINKRHARYVMDVISPTRMRRDSSAELFYECIFPQIPLRTAQKNQSHIHNSAA